MALAPGAAIFVVLTLNLLSAKPLIPEGGRVEVRSIYASLF